MNPCMQRIDARTPVLGMHVQETCLAFLLHERAGAWRAEAASHKFDMDEVLQTIEPLHQQLQAHPASNGRANHDVSIMLGRF